MKNLLIMKNLVALFSLFLVLLSCKKEQNEMPDPVVQEEVPKTGILEFEFQNTILGENIELNTGKYINSNGDTLSISKLKYYISNIVLKNSSDNWEEKDSYHLIDELDKNTSNFTMNADVGEYDELLFSIGIDSLHNLSDSTNGDIDPGTGMFWGMTFNYRFLSMEGMYGSNLDNGYVFHIGGNEHYKNTVHNLSLIPVIVREGETTKVSISVNMLSIFDSPNVIDLTQVNNITVPEGASVISGNYAENMFVVERVENL